MAVIGIFFGVMLYMWNAKSVLGNALPMPFGYGFSVVLTGSMEPVLKPDDFLVIQDKEYEIGDIIVYQEEKNLIVHRIIFMDDETIITKGDANNIPDAPVEKEQVKGVVVKTIHGLGKVVNFIQGPIGIILIAGCLFILLMPDKKKKANNKEIESEIEKLKLEIELEKERSGGNVDRKED